MNDNFLSTSMMNTSSSPIAKQEQHHLESSSKNKQSNLPPALTSTSSSYWYNHPMELKSIPDYYPLERSHQIITSDQQKEMIQNLRECFRTLGIQVVERPSGAALLTSEHIEMYLYFWKSSGERIYVELQRRQGDCIIYHRYAKHILNAVSSCRRENLQHDDDVAVSGGRTYFNSSSASMMNNLFFPPPPIRGTNSDDIVASDERKYFQLYSSDVFPTNGILEGDSSIKLAVGLLKSNRFDSQMLGMESLCMLTDRRKTIGAIALHVSRAIIFDNDDQFLHKFVFRMVLLRQERNDTMNQNDDDDDDEGFFFQNYDVIDYDDEEEENARDKDMSMPILTSRSYRRAEVILRNCVLTILSNAWEVLYYYYYHHSTNNESMSNSAQLPTANTLGNLGDQFYQTEIITEQQQHPGIESMDTILKILWKDVAYALYQPHNACLAAKCLISILRFSLLSSSNRQALKKQLLQLQGNNDDELASLESILQRAQDIGIATNARLERICHELHLVLQDLFHK